MRLSLWYHKKMQPIQIYMAPMGTGPNPWKVIVLLAELDIPYEIVWISYADIKSEPYLSLNPNGRLPSMVDSNKKVTLFESGAIIEYIVSTYDKGLKLSFGEDQTQEKWLVHSWLMLQMSAQGPMFGQRMWFLYFQKDDPVVKAIERYGEETKRIVGVIERHLQKRTQEQPSSTDGPWLVGDKCTFADLSFVLWNIILPQRLFPEGDLDIEKEFPHFDGWHKRLLARPAVARVVKEREQAMIELADQDTATEVLKRQGQFRQGVTFENGIWKDASKA